MGEGEEGLAGEAMRGNGTKTLILRVDANKLALWRKPKNCRNQDRLKKMELEPPGPIARQKAAGGSVRVSTAVRSA